jgi:hypothetical protein
MPKWGKRQSTTGGLRGKQVLSSSTTLGDLAKLNTQSMGFHNFYKDPRRPELTGSHQYDFAWLPHNRPDVMEGAGAIGRVIPQRKGRGGEEEAEPEGEHAAHTPGRGFQPITMTASPLALGYGRSGEQFDKLAIEPGGPRIAGALPRAKRTAHGERNPREWRMGPGGVEPGRYGNYTGAPANRRVIEATLADDRPNTGPGMGRAGLLRAQTEISAPMRPTSPTAAGRITGV